MFSLLRYEYRDHENLNEAPLFGSLKDREEVKNGYKCTENIDNDHLIDGARSDSFDTWIIHTNFMISEKENNAFNFRLGTLGCDNKLIYLFKRKKIWVASSTHSNEELFCAKTHMELKKKIKNLITIIIPRHIHRVNKIILDLENLNLKVAVHSSNKRNLNNTDIYIVDTFGETQKFHKISCSVFLGGSIIKRGGQNPLEAARYGARILHGPNIDNFKDVYKTLSFLKVSKKINTPKELSHLIIFKRNKNTGTKIKKIGGKILKETINELDTLINNELKKT